MRVSVVIPSYNHAAFIDRALTSVLTQSRQADEIIVVDDGSKDGTADIAETIAQQAQHGRIKVLRQSNQGAHAAINHGLEMASGDYLTILNSDDSFAPNRIATMITALNDKEGPAFSRVLHVDPSDNTVPETHPLVAAYRNALGVVKQQKEIGFALLFYNLAITTGNLFFTRGLWQKVGPFSPLRLCHDWDWLLRSLLLAQPIFIDQPLLLYRVHETNSVHSLGDIAYAEASYCLETYFRAAAATPPTNPHAPSPYHQPEYFERAIKELRVEEHWIAAMRARS